MQLKIDIKDLYENFSNYNNLKVNTPDGWQRVGGVIKKKEKQIFRVLFENGEILEVSDDHKFQLNNLNWIFTKDLQISNKILSKNGHLKVLDIEKINIQDTYDLEVLHENHRYYTNDIVSHNTGKSFIALWSALSLLLRKKDDHNKIILMKPIVEAGEKIGFLPGGVEQKMDPFLTSYYWNLEQIIGKDMMEMLIKKKKIEFLSLGFIRGITFKDCIVILDEAQNMSPEQMKTFVTRMGENCKLIILGDEKQSDIINQKVSGLTDIIEKTRGLHGLNIVTFENKDVVRHRLVKDILDRYDHFEFLKEKSLEANEKDKWDWTAETDETNEGSIGRRSA